MKLWMALLAASAALFGQVIDGTVVDSVTRLPIRGAKVEIQKGGKPAYQTTTDDQGAFRLEPVQAGVYVPDFTATDYLPPTADSPARRTIRVTAGSDPI